MRFSQIIGRASACFLSAPWGTAKEFCKESEGDLQGIQLHQKQIGKIKKSACQTFHQSDFQLSFWERGIVLFHVAKYYIIDHIINHVITCSLFASTAESLE